jgi:short-subunit dehydrogenase
MEIKDKVVIITGASQGIGLATAQHLSKLGAKVVLAARSMDVLKELEKEIPNSLAITADMRNRDDINAMVEETLAKYGRIDILINNAGQGMYGDVENMDIDHYRQIMDLNVFGLVGAMQEVIPHMRKQGGGMIVNISSGLTKMYIPGLSAYSSTKYALNALSHIARQELEEDKIIVSLVLPNLTATNFMKNSVGNADESGSDRQLPKADTAEKVAEKIAEVIASEEAEVQV